MITTMIFDVVEDSPAGVKAALAAGMAVIAVSTPFTRQRLHESGLLPEALIVDEPERVTAVAAAILRQSRDEITNKLT